MKYTYLIVILSLLSSCTQSTDSSKYESVNQVFSFSLEKENNNLQSETIDSVSFLALKEDKGFFFSTINKLIVNDGYIYVLDVLGSNSLLLFDSQGNFVRKFGSQGNGGEEYVRLWDFDVDSSSVYLYDRAKRKLLKYDKEGNFLSSENTPFRADAFKVLENNNYIFSLAKEDNKYRVVLTDSEFNIKTKFFTFDDNYQDSKITDNTFRKMGEVIMYNNPINDTLYSFSKEGELLKANYFDFEKRKVPQKFVDRYNDFVEVRSVNNYIYFFDTPIIVNNILIGKIYNGKNKATLLYNLDSKEYSIKDWLPNNLDYTDLYLPLYTDKDFIVGWLDYEIHESLKIKPNLNESMIKHLEEGGRILCYYHLRG